MSGGDNWKHRSDGMVCGRCMFFAEKAVSRQAVADVQADPLPPLGRCRRHAPLAGGGGWPAVFANDWCGDHKIDEDKV